MESQNCNACQYAEYGIGAVFIDGKEESCTTAGQIKDITETGCKVCKKVTNVGYYWMEVPIWECGKWLEN